MKNIPEHTLFKTPEGYFESLGTKTLARKKKKAQMVVMSRIGLAASVLLAVGLYFSNPFAEEIEQSQYVSMDAEIDQMIEQGIWSADDVLSMSEDPDAVLDELLQEQWGAYQMNDADLDLELLTY
ncbi:hypothetical protein GCM10007049_02290 [Echinicola pacifica]|uniref:Uncharacterized protein n=1 Tax=Echinicola pacifica TaxID=346377 RepID=A0A918UJ48_9BACT|nr:hypothetical protein [Echinicola pacifica]GGZ13988.1 hypothetical protein GCM10007049_02290 [Echinicola pacifica]